MGAFDGEKVSSIPTGELELLDGSTELSSPSLVGAEEGSEEAPDPSAPLSIVGAEVGDELGVFDSTMSQRCLKETSNSSGSFS